jgi:hypothetical protein
MPFQIPQGNIDYNKMQKVSPRKLVFTLINIFVLAAGGVIIGIAYPVYLAQVENPFWLPWIVAIIFGFGVGITYPMLLARIRKQQWHPMVSVFGVASFMIVAFMIFDVLLAVFPNLFDPAASQTYQEYLYQPKFILIVFAGGIGGIMAFVAGIISLVVYYSKSQRTKSAFSLWLLLVYGLFGLIITGILMGSESGSMDASIAFMRDHTEFDTVVSFVFGGSLLGYAIRYIAEVTSADSSNLDTRPTMITLDGEE